MGLQQSRAGKRWRAKRDAEVEALRKAAPADAALPQPGQHTPARGHCDPQTHGEC